MLTPEVPMVLLVMVKGEILMARKNEDQGTARHLIEQQVKLPSSGNDLRKGVNVLHTSDPNNPAPNPFVQALNRGTTQAEEPSSGNSNEVKRSE